jgi:capsular exopolysaccharide synthesis family protein
LETSINEVPRNEKQLLSFERKRKLYENLFIYLSQELAKAGIAQAEDISDIRTLNKARMIGTGPISPKKKLILLFGLMVGSVIPLGWIVLRYSFDDVIESENQIEQNTDIPVIAKILEQDGKKPFTTGLTNWELEESFRDLAAHIHYLNAEKRNIIIGVTSYLPGEGKSFCSVNLAMQLANGGKRVILINLDFRKPEILPKYRKKDGFSKYLIHDHIKVEDVIHQWKNVDNLSYIPVDINNDNPQSYLSSPKLQGTLENLKVSYDYIILDTPAIGIVSDYLLVCKNIDLHLFLLRYKVSRIGFLKNLEKILKGTTSNKSYIVFNGVPKRKLSYKYSGYYYQGDSGENKNGTQNEIQSV